MIFIGGINNKNLEIATLNQTMCKHCRENHNLTVYKSYYFFHFFFLPLWKWNIKYYVQCTSCQSIMAIFSEKGKEIQQGQETQLTLWDLEIIKEGEEPQHICSHCQEKVTRSYHYCPHCGEKI